MKMGMAVPETIWKLFTYKKQKDKEI